MASDVKFYLRFELSVFIYYAFFMHVASNIHFHGLHSLFDLQTASEVISSLDI